ncbi:MAG: hypothetical protein Crog4KO_00700 [Crocinitomicaceae bacterium]
MELFWSFSVMNYMRYILFLFSAMLTLTTFATDADFQGSWQGVLMRGGTAMDQGSILYVNFEMHDGVLSGHMRQESYKTDYFGLKQVKGKLKGDKLTFEQTVVENDNPAFNSKYCLLKGELTYNATNGYMTGTFSSTDCRNNAGKIILYREDFQLSKNDQSHATHSWFKAFVKEYKEGLSAPLIRKKERENFVFEPIFFDFDKSEIRDEHKDFLDGLIKIVKGHSDLRVLVTGHTDAEGSNGYNDGLSKRRAEAIVAYFVKNGLSADRLKFDFKGETDPAATNDTPEGRQRNRRVDFEFIQH